MIASAHGFISQPPARPPVRAQVRSERDRIRRFTVEETLWMVKAGIVPEDSTVELLDGLLVYCDRSDLRGGEIVEGVNHNYVVSSVAELAVKINNETRALRTHSAIVCSEICAPVADAVVLRGQRTDYRDRLPTATDAFCVVEVADSSYERDAGPKLFGYARAGVLQYIIINLRNRTAEIYTNPDSLAGTYAAAQIISADGNLPLRISDGELFQLPLIDVLP